VLAPGFDLLLTGLVGGTAAHVAAKRWHSLWRADEADDRWRLM